MTKLKTVAACLCAAALFCTPALRADAPNGTYNQDFTGIVSMWDISGNYSAGLSDLGSADLNITQDAYGNISGDGTLAIDVYGTTMYCTVTPSGKVKNDQVALTLLITGAANISGNDITLLAVAKLKLQVDAQNNQLVGGGSIKATAKNLTTGRSSSASQQLPNSTMAMPSGTDGSWNLSLNLAANGTQVTGTATANTTSHAVDFTATGTYSASSDTTKVTLAGTGPAVGAKLSLIVSTSGGTITVRSVSGKVLGQTPKYKAL